MCIIAVSWNHWNASSSTKPFVSKVNLQRSIPWTALWWDVAISIKCHYLLISQVFKINQEKKNPTPKPNPPKPQQKDRKDKGWTSNGSPEQGPSGHISTSKLHHAPALLCRCSENWTVKVAQFWIGQDNSFPANSKGSYRSVSIADRHTCCRHSFLLAAILEGHMLNYEG